MEPLPYKLGSAKPSVPALTLAAPDSLPVDTVADTEVEHIAVVDRAVDTVVAGTVAAEDIDSMVVHSWFAA